MNRLVNGEREGLWETYNSNGDIWHRCNYINGKREGLYESFYKNGNIRILCFYKDGMILEMNVFGLNTGILNRNK
jgi:antitoxin component YwqK of YwqJK toxin-antitoxin module